MSTQKVFISGSIAVKKLDNEVLSSLQKMMQNGLQILVGDAKGVDSQIQDFFKRNNYNNIVVYSIEEFPRYIASKTFGFKKIEVATDVKGGRETQTEKDIAMTNDSDFSLVIWDGKSKGSYANILRSLEQNKGTRVFLANQNSFMPQNKVNKNQITFIYYENNGYTAQEVIEFLKEDGKEFFKNSRELNSYLVSNKILEKRDNVYMPLSNHELFIVETYKGKSAGVKFTNRFIDWVNNMFNVDASNFQQEALF